MSYRTRCTRCDARRSLRKHPKAYLRAPPCGRCGNRTYYIVPPRGGSKCFCGGYPFMHRRGSKWCAHAVQTITATEAALRYGGDALDHYFDGNPAVIGNTINELTF